MMAGCGEGGADDTSGVAGYNYSLYLKNYQRLYASNAARLLYCKLTKKLNFVKKSFSVFLTEALQLIVDSLATSGNARENRYRLQFLEVPSAHYKLVQQCM